jgi:hypothetical protein
MAMPGLTDTVHQANEQLWQQLQPTWIGMLGAPVSPPGDIQGCAGSAKTSFCSIWTALA